MTTAGTLTVQYNQHYTEVKHLLFPSTCVTARASVTRWRASRRVLFVVRRNVDCRNFIAAIQPTGVYFTSSVVKQQVVRNY